MGFLGRSQLQEFAKALFNEQNVYFLIQKRWKYAGTSIDWFKDFRSQHAHFVKFKGGGGGERNENIIILVWSYQGRVVSATVLFTTVINCV